MWSSSSPFITSTTASANESPLHSIAKYIDDYMDLVDNVPNDIARQITQLHEHNHRYHQLLSQLESTLELVCGRAATSESRKRNAMLRVQRWLIEIQEIADEKLLLIQSILDQLDCKARQLDFDYRAVTMFSTSSNLTNNSRNMTLNSGNGPTLVAANHSTAIQKSETTSSSLSQTNTVTTASTSNEVNNKETTNGNVSVSSNGNGHNVSNVSTSSSTLSGKRASARRNTSSRNHDSMDANLAKRSAKRGVKGASHKDLKRTKGGAGNCLLPNSSPPLYEGAPIDPDEPTYCLCEQVSFGEMICCDNSACTIEWFHFSCVSLNTKPKGKWFCPNCRGERSNIPKK